MAGRNRNTFLKRQKEIERVRRAGEKMARRHGKRARAAAAAETAPDGPAEGVGTRDPEAQASEQELVLRQD